MYRIRQMMNGSNDYLILVLQNRPVPIGVRRCGSGLKIWNELEYWNTMVTRFFASQQPYLNHLCHGKKYVEIGERQSINLPFGI